MNKRKVTSIVIIVFIVLLVLLTCTKCTKDSNVYDKNEAIINQNTDKTIDEKYITELYTSTNGYELRYDPSDFSIKYEDGIENFIHKTEDVYFKIYVVDESEKGDESWPFAEF